MSYDNEIEFLKSYNAWVMEQKAKGVDVSPEAYMLDHAKEQALKKLITVDEMLGDLPEELFDDPKIQEIVAYINE